jgi:hypothetical protein
LSGSYTEFSYLFYELSGPYTETTWALNFYNMEDRWAAVIDNKCFCPLPSHTLNKLTTCTSI